MECNKEDAMKAKEIAEKKISEKDVAGAKKFALKALNLYPNLEGLAQLLATIEVYVSAERKRANGEIDWYGVLGIGPLADDETIRRSFRKLALSLHPDKNKSVGALGAFQLISQAWDLLSDKSKKSSYDQSCITSSVVGGNPKGQNNGNAFHFKTSVFETFWTMCIFCKTHFEYHKLYCNTSIVCNHCGKPFLAFEAPRSSPDMYKNASTIPQMMQHKNASTIHQMMQSKNASTIPQMMQQRERSSNLNQMQRNSNFSAGRTMMPPTSTVKSSSNTFFMPEGANISGGISTSSASFVGIASNNDFSFSSKTKQACVGNNHVGAGSTFQSSQFGPKPAKPAVKRERPKKKRHIDEHSGADKDTRDSEVKEMPSQNAGTYKRNRTMRDIARQRQMKNFLVELAKKNILKKLDELRVSSPPKDSDKSKKNTHHEESKQKDKERSRSDDVKSCVEKPQELAGFEILGKKPSNADNADNSASKEIDDESLSMSVPDPDFHDFDDDRTEKAFGENQVWAVYDNEDGMPRYYALIHYVISVKPLKLKISWLNSKSNDEFAPIKWVGSGFPKTCGDFRIGKHELYTSLNSFSHKVKWKRSVRGIVNIFPKKGDVWALYRNWSLDWNELTADEIIHEYDMVEVLEDYSEEQGVNVVPLVKVVGFKTVFRRRKDPIHIRNIPRVEMFRLSHQVPSYLLTGQEGPNAPTGCLELDPASTPMELLQVETQDPEQDDAQMTENEVAETTQKEEASAEKMRAGPATKKICRVNGFIVYERQRLKKDRVKKRAIRSLKDH